MITIKDFMETVNYRITEGSQFLWKCYGSNVYNLDSWDGNQDGHSVSILFDTQTQLVYEMNVSDYKNNRAYRWINPEYVNKHKNEALAEGIDNSIAWDDVYYIDLEESSEILEKAYAIVRNQPYDTRIKVPVDLEKEELFDLMMYAHEKDITLNQLVEQAVSAALHKINCETESTNRNSKEFSYD